MVITSCGDRPSAPKKSDDKSAQAADKGRSGKEIAASKISESDWPMFMRDMSYRGISPDATLRPPLALLWKFKTGGPVSSSPVVVGGTVYIGSEDNRMYALHARKWGVKWEFEAGNGIICAPTFYDGNIYFSARDNKVYALDADTGAKKWEFQADGWISSPVVAFRQKIYLGCFDKKIYVLNALTGRLESQDFTSITIGNQDFVSSQGEFFPVNFQYIANQWRKEFTASQSWPATANGVVYIGSRDNKLYAIDSRTRKEIWHFETDGWVDSSPAISNGVLYFGSSDGYVYALVNSANAQAEGAAAKNEGVVISSNARVYNQTDNMAEIIAQLHDDTLMPITGKKQNQWYEILLPDGQTGWISSSDFIPIRWSQDLRLNDALVKDIKNLTLSRKAEMPAWSPDGSFVVFFDNITTRNVYWRGGSIWLASGDGSNPRWLADGAFYNPRISWTRDSGSFTLENLSVSQRQVWMVRSNGTGLRKITEGEAPVISPNGRKVAFIRRNEAGTAVWSFDLENSTPKKLFETRMKGDNARASYGYVADLDLPAWSPDSLSLALGIDGFYYPDDYPRLAIVSASGGLIRETGVRAGRIRDIAWSPDGRYIGYVTQDHSDRSISERLDKRVRLISVDGTGREDTFDHSEGFAWSPDGRYIAFVEENNRMGIRKRVWLLDVKNWQRTQLLASRENIQRVFWFTDGGVAIRSTAAPSNTTSGTRGWIITRW